MQNLTLCYLESVKKMMFLNQDLKGPVFLFAV